VTEEMNARFWRAYKIVLKKIKASKHKELAMLATICIMHMIGDEE